MLGVPQERPIGLSRLICQNLSWITSLCSAAVEFVMAKSAREWVKLESTAGTGYFYVTSKNRKTAKEKLVKMKYDPKVRKHVEFKEVKLK